MRLETFEFANHVDTLTAVVVGAVLATLSGVLATQLEAFFMRRRRQRDAALLFGEILSALSVILVVAAEARGHGDPYGPITLRTLRAGRREIDVYDRNREALYDLRDGALRIEIHSLIVRMTMPLDGILDAAAAVSEPVRAVRDQSFDFLIDVAGQIPAIVAHLGLLARHSFDGYESAVRGRRAGE